MLEIMQERLNDSVSEFLDSITEDDVKEFMWNRDLGQEVVEEYLDESNLKEDYMFMIYDEINSYDLETPF